MDADDAAESWQIATPPFDAAAALVTLKRSLRELGFTERGALAFEWQGKLVLRLQQAEGGLQAELARRATRSPDYERLRLGSQADVRKLLDTLKQRLRRWADED